MTQTERTMTAFPPYERRTFPAGGEVGALTTLGPDTVRAAAALVAQGRVYDLDAGRFMGMPLWPGHPPLTVLGYRSPMGLAAAGDHVHLYPGKTNSVCMGFNSDMIISTTHTGAHIDALSHTTVGEDHHWFNGFHAATDLGDHGPLHADGATIPPIVARGVLVDVPGYKGVQYLGRGEAVSRGDIVGALKRQGT